MSRTPLLISAYIALGILIGWACSGPMGDNSPLAKVSNAGASVQDCNVVSINVPGLAKLGGLSIINPAGEAIYAESHGASAVHIVGDWRNRYTGMFIEGYDGFIAKAHGFGSGITGRAGEGEAGIPGAAIFADGQSQGAGIGFMANAGNLAGVGQAAFLIQSDQTVPSTAIYVKSNIWPALNLQGDFMLKTGFMTAH